LPALVGGWKNVASGKCERAALDGWINPSCPLAQACSALIYPC
jgi:hypothetical protein